jgi:hypothetical protein
MLLMICLATRNLDACYCCAAAVPAEVQPLQVRSDTSSLTTGMRNGSSFLVTQFALPLLVSCSGDLSTEHRNAFAAAVLLLLCSASST